MSKNNGWMPLYVGDYLADTMHLNGAQHGAYLLLLMHYWRTGPLENDENFLATIARTPLKIWRKEISRAVLAFFEVNGGYLHQKRMDIERAKANDISDKRRAAAYASHGGGHGPNGANAPANAPANEEQMPPVSTCKPSRAPADIRARLQSQSQLQNRKKEEPFASLTRSADAERDFDAFWNKYPRKVGKAAARRAFAAAVRKAAAEAIIGALEQAEFNPDPRFIPHPRTWLVEERWLDERDEFDPVLRSAGLSPNDFPERLQ